MPVSNPATTDVPPTHTIRGVRVVLDADVAQLYGVRTAYLRAQATRNRDRFPPDLGFRLTRHEVASLPPSAAATRSRASTWAFTAEGVAMLSTVLNSGPAAQLHVEIIRTVVGSRN